MSFVAALPYLLAIALCILLGWVIYSQVKEYHMQDDPMLYTLKEILKPVHPVIAKLKLYKGEKSYTINKERIYLCLYDENGEYYPINMIVYVLLHEIAHYINKYDVGHTETFHRIFEELLEKAARIGVYNPSIPIIQDYCNHD